MAVHRVRRASEELGDGRELSRVERVQESGDVCSQGFEHAMDVSHTLLCGGEDLLTPVAGVWFTTKVPGSLQPRHHTGNRATRQAGDRDQLATGHLPALAQHVEALEIRWAQPEALRDRVVKEHRRSAVSTRQPPDDRLDQLRLVLACNSHRIRSSS